MSSIEGVVREMPVTVGTPETMRTSIPGAPAGFAPDAMDVLTSEAAAAIAYARRNRGGSGTQRVGGNFPARHLSYWRMCTRPYCSISGHVMRRGWITIGPSPITRNGETEVTQFERSKHATRLGQYGDWSTFELDDNFSTMFFTTYLEQYPFGEFETLMTMPGGVREFPVSQIRQLRWHHNEFIRIVRPDACEAEDHLCQFCGKDFPEIAHLQNHIIITHQDQASVVALGEQINRPIDALITRLAQQQDQPDTSGVIAQAVSVLSSLAERLGIGLVPLTQQSILSPDGVMYWDASTGAWTPITAMPEPDVPEEGTGFIPLR